MEHCGARSSRVNREERAGALLVALRLVAASLLAIAAAIGDDSYDDGAQSIRLNLVAPRGSLEATPRRVAWIASIGLEHAGSRFDALQIDLLAADGSAAMRRRVADAPRCGTLELTIEERRAIETRAAVAIELLALDRHGSLVAQSQPALVESARER